jgi:hypothetical protein
VARADLQRLDKAAERLAAAREELLEAMLQARRSGETHSDIAGAARLTRQRVSQILHEHGVK